MKDWQKLSNRLTKHTEVVGIASVAQHDFIRKWMKVNPINRKGDLSPYEIARKMLLAMPEEQFVQWVVRFRLEES